MNRDSFLFVAALTLSALSALSTVGCGASQPVARAPDATAPPSMPQGAGTKRALVLVEGAAPTPKQARADVAPEEDLSTARILRKVLASERP